MIPTLSADTAEHYPWGRPAMAGTCCATRG